MIEFITLRPKSCFYLIDEDSESKKAKGTKKRVIKQRLKFNDYKDYLFRNKTILKSQQRFKSEAHDVYTEETKKIALSSKNDKRLQTLGKITTYPYETNAFKVCQRGMLSKFKQLILMFMRMKIK